MIYLSGVSAEALWPYASEEWIGLMIQPRSYPATECDRWQHYAADNGCFSEKWDSDQWLTFLKTLDAPRALFATVPDVVGDAAATAVLWEKWSPIVADLGFKPAYVATKGAGKSNAAVVLAEQMYDAGIPWVAIDPKGDWYGIRADGPGGPGLPIPILGGLHGDLPLEPEAGPLVADLIVDNNLTCVLDVSDFASKAAQIRFLTAFGDRLFIRHGKQSTVRHLFLEEADEYLPQRVMKGIEKCVHTWSKLVRQGRQRGLGVSLISQRSAVVNKDVLTQTELLIALRTTSPQDRKAIGEWVDYHAMSKEITMTLPLLDDGEAWVVSAHKLGIVGRYQFARRRTLDTGGTPKLGSKRAPVAQLTDLDLDAVRTAMAEVVERAEAADPKALRAKLAAAEGERRSLERRIAQLEAVKPEPVIERVEVPVLSGNDLAELNAAAGDLRHIVESLNERINQVAVERRAAAVPSQRSPAALPPARPRPATPVSTPDQSAWALPKAQKTILGVLATHHPKPLDVTNISVLSGYSRKSSGFQNSLSAMRTAGLIERGNPVAITEAGLAAIGDDYESTPRDPSELINWWSAKLGKAPGAILQVLWVNGPLPPNEIAEKTGYSITSSGFQNSLSRLRSLGLVEGKGGVPVVLSDAFA